MKQRERIKKLFESKPNEWIPLPEIINLHIAQYTPRIWELRHEGMRIENKWKMVNGVKHSWYRWAKTVEESNGQQSFI